MLIYSYIGLTALLALTIFQILLILGRPYGEFAWGGQHKVLPKKLRIASVFSIILYFVFAAFIVSKAGIAPIITNETVLNIGMWILVGYSVLGIFVNLISRSKKERFVMVPVTIVLTASFLGIMLTSPPQTPKSYFEFDAAAAPGWWSGGNNWPTLEGMPETDLKEEDLPIADINTFQGTQAEPGACFVMAFYQRGAADVPALLTERVNGMVLGDSGADAAEVGKVQQTIQTPEGEKEYTLYQYNLITPGREVQAGNEFGFIPLETGYIEVRGVCKTAEQLPSTLTGLNAISLK